MVSTHLKNISQNGTPPQVGVKTTNVWNHHLDFWLDITENITKPHSLQPTFCNQVPNQKHTKSPQDIAFWALPCLPNNSPVADHNSSLKSSSKEFFGRVVWSCLSVGSHGMYGNIFAYMKNHFKKIPTIHVGVPKMVGFPNNHGVFPTKNDHFGVFWGYHHLRKHPCR